jgi:hypothetical protein
MSKKTILLIVIVLLKFILQYTLISSEYDLQRDEYLHLDQAHHLAWGYLSVPPVTSWISFIIHLLGNSVFWVKFFPALFGALTIVVVWKAIGELNGNLFAQLLGATCILFSALLRLNTLYQPNSLDVLCWTTFSYVLIRYINSENEKWLYTGALVFALGFLNKYNIIFLLIGLLPAVLISPQRKVFSRKALYFSILLGVILVLPNILWQYHHDFPVYYHLMELAERQLTHVSRLDFLKSQLLFFVGSFYVIVSGLIAFWVYPPFRKYQLFFWSLLFTLSVFIYLRAKDYYAIGLYPIYIAFGSVYLEELLNTGWKVYLRPVAIAIPILIFVPAFQVAFPNKTPQQIIEHPTRYKELGLLRWEDGKDHLLPQDFADMLGWKELAKKVDSVYEKLPKNEHVFILCDNYGQAGAINYYSRNKLRAVSFHADYINWFDLDKQIVHFIRVKEHDDIDTEMETTSPYFETGFVAGSITHPYAREYGTTIIFFSGPKIDVNQRLREELEEERNRQ